MRLFLYSNYTNLAPLLNSQYITQFLLKFLFEDPETKIREMEELFSFIDITN